MWESSKLEISEKKIIFLTLREDGYSSEDQWTLWSFLLTHFSINCYLESFSTETVPYILIPDEDMIVMQSDIVLFL